MIGYGDFQADMQLVGRGISNAARDMESLRKQIEEIRETVFARMPKQELPLVEKARRSASIARTDLARQEQITSPAGSGRSENLASSFVVLAQVDKYVAELGTMEERMSATTRTLCVDLGRLEDMGRLLESLSETISVLSGRDANAGDEPEGV